MVVEGSCKGFGNASSLDHPPASGGGKAGRTRVLGSIEAAGSRLQVCDRCVEPSPVDGDDRRDTVGPATGVEGPFCHQEVVRLVSWSPARPGRVRGGPSPRPDAAGGGGPEGAGPGLRKRGADLQGVLPGRP